MRIVSDWLVAACGVGVADTEAVGDAEALDVGLGVEDTSALAVGSGDAVGVEVSDGDGLADATGDWIGSGVPPESSSARVGPTFAKKSATAIRSNKRNASVFALLGLSSK